MKKRLIAILTFAVLSLMVAAPALATWTLTPSLVKRQARYLKWQVLCTSDGSSLAATDLMSLIEAVNPQLHKWLKGSSMMLMTVSPGVSTVIPDTTINVTISNDESHSIYAKTGFSKDAPTIGNDLSVDYNQYLPVYEALYLTLNDIGSSGDQVTLIFECWINGNK